MDSFLCKKFIKLIKEEHFYEAHEALEQIWFPIRKTKNSEKDLIKGFINASVSLELFKRDKIENSKRVWKTYLKYKTLINEIDSHHKNLYEDIIEALEDKESEIKKTRD